MRLLMVTLFVPHRELGHGLATVESHFVEYFAARHELEVVTFYYSEKELDLSAEVRKSCAYFRAIPFPAGRSRRVVARLNSFAGRAPFLLSVFNAPAIREELSRLIATRRYDLVQFDTTFMGQYVNLFGGHPGRKVLVENDVSAKPMKRRYEQASSLLTRRMYRREWRQMALYESWLCRKFDRVYAVSEEDRNLLVSMNPGMDIMYFPYGVDPALFEVPAKIQHDRNLVFLGSFMHPPNEDAVLWFCKKVFPRLKAQVSGIKLYIVGASPSPAIKNLTADSRIIVTGRVPDVSEYLKIADVCLVPLRLGGGVKLKTLEMMAAGRAVVTTPVGIEGICAVPGEHALVAESAEDFASSVLQLLSNNELQLTIGRNARELILRDHQWEVNLARVEQDYHRLIGDKTACGSGGLAESPNFS